MYQDSVRDDYHDIVKKYKHFFKHVTIMKLSMGQQEENSTTTHQGWGRLTSNTSSTGVLGHAPTRPAALGPRQG